MKRIIKPATIKWRKVKEYEAPRIDKRRTAKRIEQHVRRLIEEALA